MQLVSRIRETFPTEPRVRQVFEHTTLSSMASFIDREVKLVGLDSEAVERLSEEEATEILKELAQKAVN